MNYADPQVQSFLARSMIARIATISAKGTPQLMPLWFAARDGRIYMNNAATSPTVRNIAIHPDVVLLFDADRGSRRNMCLRVRGRAQFVEGDELLRKMWLRMAAKHDLSPNGHCRRRPARLSALRDAPLLRREEELERRDRSHARACGVHRAPGLRGCDAGQRRS
jgi:general stress protein 26